MVALRALRGSAGLLLLGWLLLPSHLEAEDDFLDAYKQGRKAIEKREWGLAAEKMRQALAGRSEERPRLVKKRYLRKYLPHYFLGVALFELGDCKGALASWAESERQGVVTGGKDFYENLVQSREKCQSQARLADQIAPLERQLANLESEISRISSLQRVPELQAVWNTGSPSLVERQARAEEKLRQARALLDRARSRGDLSLLPELKNLLADAQRETRTFEQQAESQRASRRPSRIAAEPKSQPEDDQQQFDPSNQEGPPPPAELDAAVAAFLDGDYPQVIEILGDFSVVEQRAMAHAHLLRAAALFALHSIRGDAELLVLARGEASAALEADPELPLPERFFTPRFRELVQAFNGFDLEE